MKPKFKKVFLFPLAILCLACYFVLTSGQNTGKFVTLSKTTEETAVLYRRYVQELYFLVQEMESRAHKIDQRSMQKRFKEARLIYKKTEWLVDYQFRETALKINAPNLLEANQKTPNEPIYPTGFQVLEEVVFDAEFYDKKKVVIELSSLQFGIDRLKTSAKELVLSESKILHALKLNLYRMITKGITGFDAPVSLHSLPEAIATLEATTDIIARFPESQEVLKTIDISVAYLRANSLDFDRFNRAEFISKYINPLCDALHNYQVNQRIPFSTEPKSAISVYASNLFIEGAFDPFFFAPSDALPLTAESIELGERLFFEKRLSLDGSRNCASCHHPEKGFTDGLRVNESLDQRVELLRNTPTLLNSGLQAAQFLDSRVHHLEDQLHAVITNPEEMGGAFKEIENRLIKDKEYKRLFAQVFGKNKVSERNIKRALGAYVRSLSELNSRFDQYMRGNTNVLTTDEVNGFNLFMGKAKCATCHFVPLFNGSAPPFYDKAESEVLGVPHQVEKKGAELDPDLGKFSVYGINHQRNSFKTTTVRNIKQTAPYMHNGVFETLEEVLVFYNEAGGNGYGFDLPNQTLPSDVLNLTDTEIKHLIAFLGSLENREKAKK